MQYIDERFKEAAPSDTVKKIQGILQRIGIEVSEVWYDSGLENCFSLKLVANSGIPFSCGKGITKDFARASAYGEFIERLQGGLFYYKYQSIIRDPQMNIHTFAPDAKYMTVEELMENGEWMDYIIESYKHPLLSREFLAEQCRIYSCSNEEKILTLPFYSLFEKKHVYLPIGFVDQIFATNGCCVGNTRDEAWVHALSEMMERHANLNLFISGKVAPKIPNEVIDQYPIVSKIIKQIRQSGDFDIDIFDYSLGNGFPIVSTRIINKKNQSYKVNVAADPVFEIALQRTLTEIFQGKHLNNFTGSHGGTILNKTTDFPLISNVTNQLETSNGVYTADYFSSEMICTKEHTAFVDNSNKSNKELLDYILGLYKDLGKPIYVRNFSYLGFPCYRFVVPGFSEAFYLKLFEPITEYSIADDVRKVYSSPAKASDNDLTWMLQHSNMIKATFGRYSSFSRNSGLLISNTLDSFLTKVTRAYASYRLKEYDAARKHLSGPYPDIFNEETINYLACINKYVELKNCHIDDEKIKIIIGKFFKKSVFEKLYTNLENNKTPYDEFLMECDYNCAKCKYNSFCCYENAKKINISVGEIYKGFVNGQADSEFAL